jgi:hypothetical protein
MAPHRRLPAPWILLLLALVTTAMLTITQTKPTAPLRTVEAPRTGPHPSTTFPTPSQSVGHPQRVVTKVVIVHVPVRTVVTVPVAIPAVSVTHAQQPTRPSGASPSPSTTSTSPTTTIPTSTATRLVQSTTKGFVSQPAATEARYLIAAPATGALSATLTITSGPPVSLTWSCADAASTTVVANALTVTGPVAATCSAVIDMTTATSTFELRTNGAFA